MREDCKFFQRRSSRAGDPVSFCALALAPEAPWRCPPECPRYERAVGGRHWAGIPARPAPPPGREPGGRTEPEPVGRVADVLGNAEEIIGRLAPELEAEERRQRRAQREAEESWWQRLRRSPRWRR